MFALIHYGRQKLSFSGCNSCHWIAGVSFYKTVMCRHVDEGARLSELMLAMLDLALDLVYGPRSLSSMSA